MKHTKIFFALIVLAAAVLAFGCSNATARPMSTAQLTAYDTALESFNIPATGTNWKAADVTKKVAELNSTLTGQGIKILDLQEGTGLTRGTKKDVLKQRFIPVPLI